MSDCSNCALCGFSNSERVCRIPGGKSPDFCPTTTKHETLRQASEAYAEPVLAEFALNASRQEAACYADAPGVPGKTAPLKPRIVEIIEFCKRMNYQRVGLAFCGGLHREAAVLVKILTAAGLEPVSVVCKVGGVCKEFLGIREEEKIRSGSFEPMCNPVGQAMVLNEAGTQFNLVLGLCVGHDSMFMKHSGALCTVVAVKDRLLGHNPLAAIYTAPSYYNYLLGV